MYAIINIHACMYIYVYGNIVIVLDLLFQVLLCKIRCKGMDDVWEELACVHSGNVGGVKVTYYCVCSGDRKCIEWYFKSKQRITETLNYKCVYINGKVGSYLLL